MEKKTEKAMNENIIEEKKTGRHFDFRRWLTVLTLLFLVVMLCVLWVQNLSLRSALGETARLSELSKYIEERYYTDTDEEALMDSALKGYVAGLNDPYSVYMNDDEYSDWQDKEAGTMVGIGVTVQADDKGLYIVSVTTGAPADEAGIEAGDIIISVEGESVTDLGYDTAVSNVKGEEGSEVLLTVERAGESFDVKVKRSTIVNVSAEGCMLPGNIGYIHISAFRENTYEQYSEVLHSLTEEGAEAIIFDVRGNAGGLLTSVEDVLDPLLPEGDIAVANYGDGSEKVIVKSDAEEINVPMVVLMNGGTASAGELFAASLSDFGKAELVGETTFGKGIMQDTGKIADGALTLTVATYRTVKGECYHGVGVKPDREVFLSEGYTVDFANPDIEGDAQLSEAVQALTE